MSRPGIGSIGSSPWISFLYGRIRTLQQATLLGVELRQVERSMFSGSAVIGCTDGTRATRRAGPLPLADRRRVSAARDVMAV
jgi:hypothetical protein